MLERVRHVHPEAAAIMSTLPEAAVAQLVQAVPSARLLAIGLLAAVHRTPVSTLSLRFKIPETWVIKNRDLCLQALRHMPTQGEGRKAGP